MNQIPTGVLVAFSYGMVAGSKKDAIITKEITESKHAGDDAGTWSNKLFPASTCGKVTTFSKLRRHLGQCRQFHYSRTFMFEDVLWRILPERQIESYKHFMEVDGKKLANEMLEAFIVDLPNLIDLARLGRGTAFRESDYPTVEEVRAKFEYTVKYRPMPTAAGLNPVLFQEAIAEINELNERRLQEANANLIERFLEPFKTLSDQLANPGDRRLKPVLDSIMEFVDLVPSLDMVGNTELQSLASTVKEKFQTVTPDMIKKDEEQAKMVGQMATTVIGALQNLSRVPVRKFE